ncbi:MAG: acetylornithine deacetylase [Spirochaetaceae bacterium]|nr:acetylornithine deacetylase [Spirochaetaceae bacterium]MCF7948380.1 acetylornithine deacetylase [Spirochaetia bacterium]MCF7951714.1 acetylornithine deacetylase [Spirochaetaceae bacterium]
MDSKTHLLSRTEEILSQLVSFQSVTGHTGEQIINWVRKYLSEYNLQVHTIPFPPLHSSEGGSSMYPANIFTTIGPYTDGGVCFSGHLDVVPVRSENWTRPPFELSKSSDGSRYYGRGTSDMKGFAALLLAMVPEWINQNRSSPIHLAFTYDEESGCRGAPYLTRTLGKSLPAPATAIIGEPTNAVPILGHKGGLACRTEVTGVPAHSSNPNHGVNAIYIATDIVNYLRSLQGSLATGTLQDQRFNPSHSTISVGTIEGGSARNIIPQNCNIVWELRSIPEENQNAIIEKLDSYVQNHLLTQYRSDFPTVDIRTTVTAEYPPLKPESDSAALRQISELGCKTPEECVTFGTEAGHYQAAGISSAVWGPGDIQQAHINNEYIERDQLVYYLSFLQRV